MTHPPFRLSISEVLVLGLLVSAASCEQWFLSINSDGLVFVAVVVSDDTRRDPFQLRIREADGSVRVQQVPPSGRAKVNVLADGLTELTLLLPAGCEVDGDNPRTMTVTSGQPVRVNFNVQCT